jgi:hypothetical protein
MTPQQGLIVLALGFLAYAVLGALYVAGSYMLARKFGSRVLPIIWLVTSLIFGGSALRRGYLPYNASGPIHWGQLWIAVGLCVMFFVAFGLATLSVRARLRKEPRARLSVGAVGRGVGAFFCGLAIMLALFLVSDVRRLLSP